MNLFDKQDKQIYKTNVHGLRNACKASDLNNKLAVEDTENKKMEMVLSRYKLLSEYARDIIIFVRGDGRIIEANDSAVKAYGYSRDELLSMDIYDLRDQETRPMIEFQMDQANHNGILFDTIHQRKDGSTFHVEVSSQGTTIDNERVLLSVIRDISDRKKMEDNLRLANEELEASYEEIVATEEELKQKYEELKKTEEALRAAHQQLLDIIEFLPDATFVVGNDKKIIAWNKAMEEMTGLSKKDMIGKGNYAYTVPFYGVPRPGLIDLVLSGDMEIELLYDHVERRGQTLYTEIFVPSLFEGNGAYIWVKTSPLFDSNRNLVGAIESIRDITERKLTEEQLKYLSQHDTLTKLFNRAYFEAEMGRFEEGGCNPTSIIVCDVDGLKLVNDTLGHEAGDNLLKAVARVLNKSFRGVDMVARIGGDEFAVLLPNCDIDAVKGACDRLRSLLNDYNSANPDIPLSLSIGFATKSDAVKLSEVFKEADNNMYREKLHRRKSARSAMVQTLMKALEARDYITEGHADRMQNLVVNLARAIKLPEQRMSDLRLLAKFHDIGKVGIPDRILFKPGPLTTKETNEMRRHCEIGYRIAMSSPDLIPIAEWVLKHHEWWNGNGYPLGLKGEEIPLECRILAIVDAYDAMTSDRPYRKAMSHEAAVIELRICAGTQFDPLLLDNLEPLLHENKARTI